MGRRVYHKPETILRHVLAALEANPKNFAQGTLRKECLAADDGYARCAVGWILHFAADFEDARCAKGLLRRNLSGGQINRVNDSRDGRQRIIAGLKRALV